MRIDLNAKTTNLPETKGSPRATAAHPPAREPFGRTQPPWRVVRGFINWRSK